MVRDDKGEEMHKSKGNSIEFNEAADKMGVDIARWIYVTQNPEYNVNFGYATADEVRRRFYLILWNSYKFFVEKALSVGWACESTPSDINDRLTVLDKWVLSELTDLVLIVNKSLEKFEAFTAAQKIEDFVVNDLSTWYIRRSRDRVGPLGDPQDQTVFLSVSYGVLVTLTKLMAPFMPFITETMFVNLTAEESVHLQSYPLGDQSLLDKKLMEDMAQLRKLVEVGHAQRKEANIKLRQPLSSFRYHLHTRLSNYLEKVMADELNVKSIEYSAEKIDPVMDLKLTPELEEEGNIRDLIRQIQVLRKEAGLTVKDKIKIVSHLQPTDQFKDLVLKQTNAVDISSGEELKIEVV